MRLRKAAVYAISATIHIAEHRHDGPVGARVIAEAHDLPFEYLSKILQQLVKAGLLISETGRRGGFELGRPAGEITLLQVVEAIGGPSEAVNIIPDEGPRSTHVRERLAVLSDELREHARQRLDSTTLLSLMGRSG